jgi:glycosyltransferase involved in cell wall biosynthesis
MMNPYLSIVIPLLNEAESLPQLYGELTQVLEDYGRPYEIIFIDDGSRDDSFSILKTLQFGDRRLCVIRFRRRFGQTAAFAAGFRAARGEWIVTMDGDLQNDPHDIPKLVAIAEAGNDVVSGWRVNRKDKFLSRRLPSMVANWLISLVTGVHLHDFGCSLKVYHRVVAKELKLYGEMHRFIPALTIRIGVQIAEVEVNHRARRFGSSKYTISRTVRTLLDLVTVRFLMAYDTRPIHVFGGLGLASTTLGVFLGVYLSCLKLFYGQAIGDRPLLMLAVLLMLVGIQFVTTGLMAEVLMRTYYEAQKKPTYFVREILDEELALSGQEDYVLA